MIDKRVIERQIRKGKLDAAAFRRTLEGLPDLSDRIARGAEEPSRGHASQQEVSEPAAEAAEAAEPRASDAGAAPDATASY